MSPGLYHWCCCGKPTFFIAYATLNYTAYGTNYYKGMLAYGRPVVAITYDHGGVGWEMRSLGPNSLNSGQGVNPQYMRTLGDLEPGLIGRSGPYPWTVYPVSNNAAVNCGLAVQFLYGAIDPAVRLWTPEEGTRYEITTQIACAMGPNNYIHIVGTGANGYRYPSYIKFDIESETFGTLESLYSQFGYAVNWPDIAVSVGGVVHLVYYDGNLYYSSGSGSWSPKTQIAGANHYPPKIVLDSNGSPHVGTLASTSLKRAYLASGSWALETIESSGVSVFGMAVDSEDNVQFVAVKSNTLYHYAKSGSTWARTQIANYTPPATFTAANGSAIGFAFLDNVPWISVPTSAGQIALYAKVDSEWQLMSTSNFAHGVLISSMSDFCLGI